MVQWVCTVALPGEERRAVMGEVINLAEWKKAKEEVELAELKAMIADMEEPWAPMVWTEEWLDCLPILHHLTGALDGYSGWEPEEEPK